MVFSSLSFLILFLPPVLGVYYMLPDTWRNYWLFAASLLFYALGEPVFVAVFAVVILFTWGMGLALDKASDRGKKRLLFIGAGCLVCLLAVFKYGGYTAELLSRKWGRALPLSNLALPIGISFYAFQAVSYLADVRWGAKAQKNPAFLGLYLAFFPQLIAGPIVRYEAFAPQLSGRRVTWDGFSKGMIRFSAGLCRKVLLANPLGAFSDHVFSSGQWSAMSSGMLWLAALAYTLQIYFDFSGYSDMAIGLGSLFGFSLPENFDRPYTAGSATAFWRRWHMTLSQWFRDYVYIPLGGSQRGFPRECANLLLVWGLTGIWHGAGGTFLVWGLAWGVLLILEKGVIRPEERPVGFRAAYRVFFALCLVLLWVVFRAPGLSAAGMYLREMFAFHGAQGRPYEVGLWLHDLWPYLAGGVFLALGGMTPVRRLAARVKSEKGETLLYGFSLTVRFLLTGLAFSTLVNSSYNPFLYFNF